MTLNAELRSTLDHAEPGALVHINATEQPVTTSLVVSERFGKLHKDVLKAVKNLDCSDDFNGRNFAPVEYTDAKGESRPMYDITRDGFMFLAMGFTGKEAAQWKERFIAAFNWLENDHRQRVAVDTELLDTHRRLNAALESQIRETDARAEKRIKEAESRAFVRAHELEHEVSRLKGELEYSELWRTRAVNALGPMEDEEGFQIQALRDADMRWAEISRNHSYRSPSSLRNQLRRWQERKLEGGAA